MPRGHKLIDHAQGRRATSSTDGPASPRRASPVFNPAFDVTPAEVHHGDHHRARRCAPATTSMSLGRAVDGVRSVTSSTRVDGRELARWSFWSLAQIIVGFVAIVGVGWAAAPYRRASPPKMRGPLNAIIIYVGLPALIFRAVHRRRLDLELALIAGVAWVVFTVGCARSRGCSSRALGLCRAGRRAASSSPPRSGNTGYIGYPVAHALLGDEGLVRAIFYDVFGTVAALLFVGLLIAQRMGSAEARSVNPVMEVLTFPAVIALFAALASASRVDSAPGKRWVGPAC